MRTTIVELYAGVSDLTDRFILLAHFEGNYTQDEIGQMLHISQVAVNKRLHKAIALLRSTKSYKQVDE